MKGGRERPAAKSRSLREKKICTGTNNPCVSARRGEKKKKSKGKTHVFCGKGEVL